MPIDTRQDTGLVPATQALRTLAAEHSAEADAVRKLSPQVIDALRDAGFARHFVAGRWGGTEGSFSELTRAVLALGQGCAAASWCASLYAYSARMAAHLPADGQRELWGHSADVLVAAGLVPAGTATPEGDGHRLSGRWNYVSGIESADWVLVCSPVPGTDQPELRFFALPRGSFGVKDTWDSIGLRGTGSHTLVADEVHVPEHLSFARAELISGHNPAAGYAAHAVPLQAVAALTFVAPAAGAAQGALDAFATAAAEKRRTPSVDVELLRASGRVDTARHLIEQNAAVVDEGRFTSQLLSRGDRNAAFAAETLSDAVHGMMRAAGTGGLAGSGRLQQFWRDVTGATSHVALRYETAATRTYTAFLLGG